MRYLVRVAGETLEVELDAEGVRVEGEPVSAELHAVPGGPVHSLLIDGASHRLVARGGERGHWDLTVRGWRLATEVEDERTRRARELTGSGVAVVGPRPMRAPMPGLVVRVEVDVGDTVQKGQGLVIVEAMKMENELRAEVPGRVLAVHVRPGGTVEKDQVLIDLGPVAGLGESP